MKPEPHWLYPGRPLPGAARGRVARGASRRLKRLVAGVADLSRLVGETATVSERSRGRIARDMAAASMRASITPQMFAGQMMWAVPPERHGDFIRGRELDPFFAATLDPIDRKLMQDKAAYADHLHRVGLPCVPTLAVVHRSAGDMPADVLHVERIADLRNRLVAVAAGRDLLLKPAIGKQGHGIYRVASSGDVVGVDGEAVDFERFAANVFDYRHPAGDCGYVVQPFLTSHPDLVRLSGCDALATLRVITARCGDTARVLAAFLKFPARGKLTNNFVGGVTGSVLMDVDPSSGRFGPVVGLLRPGFRFAIEQCAVYPSSGRRIENERLPAWEEARELAERGAALHPDTATLGWDLAYATTGWTVLEANTMWGPGGPQAASQRGLRPVLREAFPRHW
jgi:hypothetical protein